tara:strand:- start:36 stop:698 length:663 start_codon:yes stop_codon:yes gene_type:complete
MSTTFKPFGLKPVYHPSGLDRAVPFVGTNTFVTGSTFTAPYSLSAGESFFQYQPVSLTASGQLTIANQTAASGTVYGVFNGVEYTTAEGRRTVGKSASKATLDAATQILFWIFSDPALVYEAQVNGSATTAYIGRQYNFDTTAGSTVTSGTTIGTGGAGFSTTALLATPVATTVQGQVRVVGLGREVAYPTGELNAWGDAYTIVQVQIANNTFVAPKVSI